MFDPTLTTALNGGTGLLLIAVAIFVYALAPRERGNLAFAIMSGGWGLRQVCVYTALSFTPEDPRAIPFGASAVVGTFFLLLGLVLTSLWFPRPWRAKERRLARLPVLILVAMVATGLAGALLSTSMRADYDHLGLIADALYVEIIVNVTLLSTGFTFLMLLLAQRFHASLDRHERAQHVLLTVAFAPYAGMIAGAIVVGAPWPLVRYAGLVQAAAGVFVAVLWLRNASARGAESRSARNVAWFVLAMFLLGMAAAIPFAGTPSFSTGPQFGIARIALVLALAYAVIRHQLLGIDVKVRWTISKSTIAASFIAVFFVASEVAQQFFGETLGSTYVGIAAAGTLVFAISPLQRAAERIAEHAVPIAPSGSRSMAKAHARPADHRLELYRRAVRFAYRDGRFSRDEELHLFELAQELGIGAGEAMRIRQEVESALAGEAR